MHASLTHVRPITGSFPGRTALSPILSLSVMTTPTPTPPNDRDQTLPLPGGQPADALGTGKINAQQPIVAADPLQMATILDNLLFNKVDTVDKSLVKDRARA